MKNFQLLSEQVRAMLWAQVSPIVVALFVLCANVNFANAQRFDSSQVEPSRLILAHYMPWYSARPFSSAWGWHWTMNAFDPETEINGRPQLASHFSPLIGPYDSGDPEVLEYQLLTMKLAGIDGVIVDWYGLEDFRDYRVLHQNTLHLVEQIERLEMKFVICYEDQTIPSLIEAGRVDILQRVDHAVREIDWMATHWFALESYVKVDGKPLLLSFGQTGLTDQEWSQTLEKLDEPVSYFSLHHRRSGAAGAFDWPIPSLGEQAVDRFQRESKDWDRAIPVVFPRFVDIYAEAKVGASYGRIEDQEGALFERLLQQAIDSPHQIIQLATWNDWGEGTMIEPSHEFGYRDLEVVWRTQSSRPVRQQEQQLPQHQRSRIAETADDLRLPFELLQRRRGDNASHEQPELDQIAKWLAEGHLNQARDALR